MHELYRNIWNYQAVFSLNEEKGNVSVNIYIFKPIIQSSVRKCFKQLKITNNKYTKLIPFFAWKITLILVWSTKFGTL